jgi:hypothetical protein
MVNKTPLRLVAIEESPPAEDEQDVRPQEGTPVRAIPEQEAITRKVEAAATIAARDALPGEARRRLPSWQSILPAAGVAVLLVAVVVGLVSKGKARREPAPVSPPAATPARAPDPTPRAAPPVALAQPPAAKPAVETIRLQVTAEPASAELSLDGNVVADHHLSLEVPKDRGIHVVSASAPGYLPFNQQVSFSSDVVLTISLRRSHSPVNVRPAARSQKQAIVEPKAKTTPRSTPDPTRFIEPGMNMETSPMRSNTKAIDERNPYAP